MLSFYFQLVSINQIRQSGQLISLMAGLGTEEKKMEFLVLFVQNWDDTFERQIVWRVNLSC